MADELKPLSNELYEHYPLMSAQTHEAHVKAYAKAHMKEGNTRPAAPVEGLVCETCNGTGNEGRGLICRDCDEPTPPTVLVRYTLDNRPNYDHDGNPYADPVMSPKINGEYVRLDQAEAIIAAERAKLTKEEADHTRSLEERDRYQDVADKLAQAIADRYQAEIGEHSNINSPWQNALDLIEADNAALTERVKELGAKAEIWELNSKTWAESYAQQHERAEALEAQLAAARKALRNIAEDKDAPFRIKVHALATLEAKP